MTHQFGADEPDLLGQTFGDGLAVFPCGAKDENSVNVEDDFEDKRGDVVFVQLVFGGGGGGGKGVVALGIGRLGV